MGMRPDYKTRFRPCQRDLSQRTRAFSAGMLKCAALDSSLAGRRPTAGFSVREKSLAHRAAPDARVADGLPEHTRRGAYAPLFQRLVGIRRHPRSSAVVVSVAATVARIEPRVIGVDQVVSGRVVLWPGRRCRSGG